MFDATVGRDAPREQGMGGPDTAVGVSHRVSCRVSYEGFHRVSCKTLELFDCFRVSCWCCFRICVHEANKTMPNVDSLVPASSILAFCFSVWYVQSMLVTCATPKPTPAV